MIRLGEAVGASIWAEGAGVGRGGKARVSEAGGADIGARDISEGPGPGVAIIGEGTDSMLASEKGVGAMDSRGASAGTGPGPENGATN